MSVDKHAPSTAGAIRPYSDEQLKKRIELNRNARFGLEQASPSQLNIVWILCRRWQLDPVTDITLIEGHPWITIEGHLRLLRRHPEYRGFDQRPLSQEEKVAWGYEPDDVVVETSVRTETWGTITQRGKVSRKEIDDEQTRARARGRRGTPVLTHPVEMAEKRSLARAHRAAFGQDAPDEAEMEREVVEEMAARADPVQRKALAAEYDRIYADPYAGFAEGPPDQAPALPNVQTEPDQDELSELSEPSGQSDQDVWLDNRELSTRCAELRIHAQTLPSTTPLDQVGRVNAELRKVIAQAERESQDRAAEPSLPPRRRA